MRSMLPEGGAPLLPRRVRSKRGFVMAPKTVMLNMTTTSVVAMSVARCESSDWPLGSK